MAGRENQLVIEDTALTNELDTLEMKMIKKVHIVINPAAGQPQPILNQINDILYPAGIEWSVSITLKSGDATRFARQAIAESEKADTRLCTRERARALDRVEELLGFSREDVEQLGGRATDASRAAFPAFARFTALLRLRLL